MTNEYAWGLLTVPAALVVLAVLTAAWFRSIGFLARHGVTFSVRWKRDLSGVSAYTLDHDIWWERSFGPVFAGGWYHERLRFDPENVAPGARINRWIGLGSTHGPCLCVFRSRNLGKV